MKNLRVAGRYAKSLIDLAQEQGQLDAIKKDMDTLGKMTKVRDFSLLLKSPVVSPSKKKSILNTLLDGRVSTLMKSFVDILVNKGRESVLVDIADAFHAQYRDIKNISAVKVTSAVALTDQELDRIRQQLIAQGLTEAQVDFQTAVDPSLIGGFVLEFGGRVYDASVSHKLNELRRDFDQPNVFVSQIDAS